MGILKIQLPLLIYHRVPVSQKICPYLDIEFGHRMDTERTQKGPQFQIQRTSYFFAQTLSLIFTK